MSPALAVPPGHTVVVASVPSTLTPDIVDGVVEAIYDAGSKVIAVGSFNNVQNRNSDTNIARRNVVAFTKSTGVVDTAFAPTVDGASTSPERARRSVAGRFARSALSAPWT